MTDAIHALRAREFPWTVAGDQIFLNHASTGPLPQRAVERIQALTALRAQPWRYTTEMQFGELADARVRCARLIGAEPREIALTVNTSYGLNLAARALPFEPGDIIVTSDREYPSNIYPWMELEVARGVKLERIPCAGMLPDEEAILATLDRPRVRCVVLSWVSFATGYRIDIERIGRACRERGIWFVLDAIQGVSAAPLDVRSTPVDIVACGAQKWLLAPWGSGFVWLRPDLVDSLRPVDVSWMATRCSDDFTRLTDYDFTYREDARKFEVITLPYQDFAGLNESLDVFFEVGLETVYERVERLTGRIVDWALGTAGVRLVTPPERERRAGIVAVAPHDPAAASERLARAGVIHSLREGAIRLSPHFYNTEEEIDAALELLGR
ncbi:MAG TPA: aminotransferase class V-fold PLP-dependent enzyme [Gemmatimonadaceae bacterium]|nr:aminotransferase class V-fold PLP-dependent enzyme [Gemmatimonadaceae bacterium]